MGLILNNISTLIKKAYQGGKKGKKSKKCGGDLEYNNPAVVVANSGMKLKPTVTPTFTSTVTTSIGGDCTQNQDGGKVKTIKGAYKKYLNKFTLDILQKEAKKKGIKITTKKNGKISYIKKASLINKITIKKFSKS